MKAIYLNKRCDYMQHIFYSLAPVLRDAFIHITVQNSVLSFIFYLEYLHSLK